MELEEILKEEQLYYSRIPDNLIGSERAERSEEVIDILEYVIDELDEVI